MTASDLGPDLAALFKIHLTDVFTLTDQVDIAQLARAVAILTEETPAQAVRNSIQERLERKQARQGR